MTAEQARKELIVKKLLEGMFPAKVAKDKDVLSYYDDNTLKLLWKEIFEENKSLPQIKEKIENRKKSREEWDIKHQKTQRSICPLLGSKKGYCYAMAIRLNESQYNKVKNNPSQIIRKLIDDMDYNPNDH